MRFLCRIAAISGLSLVAGVSGCTRSPIAEPFAPDAPYGETVRSISLDGHRHTRESIIRDALETEVGEPYDRDVAYGDFNRLMQLGVFTEVIFETDYVEDGIALTIRMSEVGKWIPTIAWDYTEENGFSIGPAIATPNLFGRSTKSSFSAMFGGATNIGFYFADPWRRDSDWYGCCYAGAYFHGERVNKLDDFDEISDEADFQWLYSFSDRLHFGPRFEFIGVKEKSGTESDSTDIILDPDGYDNIPGLGAVVEYDSRNLQIYPTSGWYIELSGIQHGGFLGGVSDFFRTTFDVRRYFPLPWAENSLAFYSLLTLTTGEMGVDIPIHQDYHIGGTNTVRGWSLDAREGKNQFLNTAEYWFPVIDRSAYELWFLRFSMGVQLAAFGDFGTAWDTSTEFRENWIAGGGLGVRLIIPQMVMMRFDLALGEPSFGLSFHFGTDEKAAAQRFRVR